LTVDNPSGKNLKYCIIYYRRNLLRPHLNYKNTNGVLINTLYEIFISALSKNTCITIVDVPKTKLCWRQMQIKTLSAVQF